MKILVPTKRLNGKLVIDYSSAALATVNRRFLAYVTVETGRR
jgi:hypothetical protein